MDQNCMHQKVYCSRKREYYFFTWSVPDVFLTENFNLQTVNSQMANGYSYYATLNVSESTITFKIVTSSSYLKCFVSMVIGSKTLLLSNNLSKPTCKESNGWNTFQLVNLSAEDESFQKMKQHPNGTLKFICKIIYSPNMFTTGTLKTLTSTDCFQNLKTLAIALKNSSESERISLRVGEEIETASKVVLCARSPVFAKMFENDMKELNEKVVTITDIKMPVIKALVSFLYTGKLSISDSEQKCKFDFLCDLYYAADKYEIVELLQQCVDMLLPLISMTNLHQIMKLAFSHNDELLKSTAIAKIATNIETWFSTDDWKNLVDDQPKIAAEVLSFFDF